MPTEFDHVAMLRLLLDGYNDNNDPFTLRRLALDAAIAALQAQQPGTQAVCNADGSWLWLKLMDWCKKQRIAPATQNALFAIAGEAHKLYVAPQPPSIPEPSDADVDVACEALDFDNDVFAHMRERVQGVLTTDRARLRERIGANGESA